MRRRQGTQFAYEQEIGNDPDFSLQQDKVRVEYVRTGSGTRLLLAVIADGDGHVDAGKVAEHVIHQVFETVQRSKKSDIHSLLVDGLTAGNSAIAEGGRVAAMVMAIRNDQIFLAQAGHTTAFLVRKGNSFLLSQPGDEFLGLSSAPMIITNSSRREVLQAGDNIILCTDGLTAINPEDGKSYVAPTDLSGLIADNSPLEAARHIISIAMGRDVEDNVSVVVIQTPDGEKGGRKLGLLVVALVALVLIVVLAVLSFQRNAGDASLPTADYGYAVVLSGSVLIDTLEGEGKPVGRLGTIPPLAVVVAQEPTRLSLKSNIISSTDVSLITVYLSSRSTVVLQSLDTQQDVGDQDVRIHNFPTSLTYLGGSVLILRGGGAQGVEVEVGDVVTSLAGTGRTILSVRSLKGMFYVDCVQGGCAYQKDGEEIIPFKGGQSLMISQSSNEIMELSPLLANTIAIWDDLCGGCLSTQ